MSTLNESLAGPVLPGPVPHRGRLSILEFVRALRENTIAAYAQEAYECDILERNLLGRRRFIVNEPAAIKRVLIDNAANYQKTEIGRRVLEPGLGKGLITSEGETWRQHRRTMSPAFDHRSIAAYTPIMTGAAEELLAEWGKLACGRGIDVASGDDAGDSQYHFAHDVFERLRQHRAHHGAQRRPLPG